MMIGYFLLLFLAPAFGALVVLVLFMFSPAERADPSMLSTVPAGFLALSSIAFATYFVVALDESPVSPFVLVPLASCLILVAPIFVRALRSRKARLA